MNYQSNWISSPANSHATIASFQSRQLVSLPPARPEVESLAPGESVSFSTGAFQPEVRSTHDDRVVFRNGASIEDKPDESGLLVTDPQGKTFELPGFINYDYDNNTPLIYFGANEDHEWLQSFPAEGGTMIARAERNGSFEYGADRSISVAADGSIRATARDWEEREAPVAASRQGQAVVLHFDGSAEAIRPAVSLDWLIP